MIRPRAWCAVTAALALTAVPAATQQLRFRDQVFANVAVTRDIPYGSAVNRFTNRAETLLLDLYEPQGDQAPARPAIVVVHGGGFVGGDKGTSQFRTMCTDLARRGFLVTSINYRLKPRSAALTRQVITDAAHDFKASVRWLRRYATQRRVDPTRIGCIGSSAGAFTILEAAYVPGEGSSGNPGHSSAVQVVVDLWGGLADENELGPGEAPLLIVHGTQDPTVSYAYATRLKTRADAVGVPAELLPLQGAGHAPWSLYNQNVHVQVVVPTLWRWLELDRLTGLGARPGWSSPGTLTVDAAGEAGDALVLLASAAPANVPLPPLGTLLVDLSQGVALPATRLPATPRLPTATWRFPVPARVQGAVHWQVFRAHGLQPRALSNTVVTTF